MEISVANAVFKALEAEGVELVFGIPGGTSLPLYDALVDHPAIRHVLTRHEQGAIHGAQGYARSTGRVGVVMTTSGPGATNLVTGLCDANMDSTPVVAITAQVSRNLIGRDVFQEADIVGISMPITKHSFQVQRGEDVPQIIKEAFFIARTGRPGPVLVDIPKDILNSKIRYAYPEQIRIAGYTPRPEIDQAQVERAVAALLKAERPVAVVGGGAMATAEAPALLRELIEQLQMPVASTLMGLGGFPQSSPLSLGLLGMHGTFAANRAVAGADLVLAVGCRFSDRLTGKNARFAPHATIIHLDIDPAEVDKNMVSQIPLMGDCGDALAAILAQLGKEAGGSPRPDRSEWLGEIAKYHAQHPFWGERPRRDEAGRLIPPAPLEPGAPVPGQRPEDPPKPQQVLQVMHQVFGSDSVVVTDVGQHQMWSAHYLKRDLPRTWLSSCGLGTMGFGLPAAMGAALGMKGARPVVLITGDGSFQMNYKELATVVQEGLPVKILVLNNGYLGLVRQLQECFHDRRYSGVDIHRGAPDFAKLADAYGVRALSVERLADVPEAVQALHDHAGPMLLVVRTVEMESVFPIVPPGAANTEPIIR